MSAQPLPLRVLDAAVEKIGGQSRAGQGEMVAAVSEALQGHEHLLIQAGTGTGKSLGYLAPALVWTLDTNQRVIVATATLALQTQLASKDIPAAVDAVEEVTGRRARTAILKGRSNYACLLRVRDGVGADQDSLLGGAEIAQAARTSGADAESVVGAEVLALREWAEKELAARNLADRDDAPPHTPRAWAQVSVPVRECLGAVKCPYGQECFVELSRVRAREANLVVTNHALLAIDAMHGGTALPEHAAVIIDEAHELTTRVTGAASAELSPQHLERLARRAMPWLDDDLAVELLEAADAFKDVLDECEVGRVLDPDGLAVQAFQTVRAVTRRVISALSDTGGNAAEVERTQTAAAIKEAFDVAERMAGLAETDVVWISERERFGRQSNVAPLSVAALMRTRVLDHVTTVLTSATLTVGGSFDTMAGNVGLKRSDRIDPTSDEAGDEADQSTARTADDVKAVIDEEHSDSNDDAEAAPDGRWRGLDVGSPFNHRSQGILYLARDLPNPSRDGISPEVLSEVAELVWASGGGALGLFASQRSAEAAAAHLRRELPSLPVLCQGDAQLPELTRRFVDEPHTSLFGTLSLWQGIDVPGDTCQLVIIDKIPFPRPDDPLMQARQQAVAQAGGNGFMSVAAAHAGLLLAQGSGRLIRRLSDRGVVAVLDPRLVKARYGAFLRASMPDFWTTTDHDVAIEALRRLSAARAAD